MDQKPHNHHIQDIIDPIDLTFEQIGREPELPSSDDVAWLALSGLKESVHLGYMRDHNARAIFKHYFPTYEYGE